MGDSLRDQLIRAGLVDEKRARGAKHQQRVDRKKKGREGVEAERAAREVRARAEREARRAADTARESDRGAEQSELEGGRRVAQIVASGCATRGVRGRRRFYFLARDERLPYIEVSEGAADKLERGALALAESPDGEVTIIEAGTARRVVELDGDWLRVFRATR